MNDLEEMWQRLLATSHRQQKVFAYHIADDGLPVWDTPELTEEYTTETYHAENLP